MASWSRRSPSEIDKKCSQLNTNFVYISLDFMSRLVWLLDYSVPAFQIADCLVLLIGGAYCIWSASRKTNWGVMLLGIACLILSLQLLAFFVSAFQPDGCPLVPLPLEIRRSAYAAARLLGPPHAMLFAISIYILARRNLSGSTGLTNRSSQPLPGE